MLPLIEVVECFLHLATRSLVARRHRRIESSAVHITSLFDLSDLSEQFSELIVGCDVAWISGNHLSKLRERVFYSTLLFKLESQSIARKRIIWILRNELFQHISARFHRFGFARQDEMPALNWASFAAVCLDRHRPSQYALEIANQPNYGPSSTSQTKPID